MFQTQGSESFTAHQDLIRGDTFMDAKASLIDSPTASQAWGCDSNGGTNTSLITTELKYEPNAGPFPCTKDFPNYASNSYQTLRDLLDAKAVSWKYYTPQFEKKQDEWDLGRVRHDRTRPLRIRMDDGHIASPEKSMFSDIRNGKLPAMSWVIPDAQNSDHPGYAARDTGPSWVASVVNAIGQS